MLVKRHILLGLIFSLILFLFIPKIKLIGVAIIFLSSVLIDTDHYIYYIFKEKNFNLKKAIKYFVNAREKKKKLKSSEKKKYYSGWNFLHGIEFLILLFVLGIFISKYFFLISIGVTFHLFLDLIEQIYLGGRIDKISIVYDFFKFKKLKRF